MCLHRTDALASGREAWLHSTPECCKQTLRGLLCLQQNPKMHDALNKKLSQALLHPQLAKLFRSAWPPAPHAAVSCMQGNTAISFSCAPQMFKCQAAAPPDAHAFPFLCKHGK